jgi:competence protein ComEC
MSARIAASVPRGAARFVQALALGDTRALTDDDWQVLRAAGLTHLIAISGFHVGLAGLFGGALAWLCWRGSAMLAARLPRAHASAWAGLLMAVAYAAAAGLSLPTLRTVLMIAVVSLARLRRRSVSGVHTLALALFAVLVVDPLSVLLAGFWLSFGGVAWLMAAMPQGGMGKVMEFLKAQWVATLGLLPLGAWWFGQVSWVGPVANLFAVPWWSLVVVPLALAGLALESLGEGAGTWLWRLAAWAFEAAWPMFQWLGTREFAVSWLPETSSLTIALALFGALGWLLPRPLPGRVLAGVLWVPLFWPDLRRPPAGEVELVALDVGQGLAVVVLTQHHAMLYDTGPKIAEGFDAGERVVVPSLRALGVSRLDRLVLSHGDMDHAGGLPAVHAQVPIEHLQAPAGAPLPLRADSCVAGEQWQWDGVRFRFLHPPPRHAYVGNESSCVLRVETAAGAVLLTGDIGRVVEQQLLAHSAADLRADVVFAPHHGSKGSSSPSLVRASDAQLVVFSAGHGNSFGHPRPEVVRRWTQSGAEALNTARSGAVRVWLGPQGLRVREQRQWQLRWWDAAVRPRPAAILSASKQAANVPEG